MRCIILFREQPGVAITMMLLGVIGGGALAWGHAILTTSPPVQALNTKMLNPILTADEYLRFAAWDVKTVERNCTGSITREFYRPVLVDGFDQREKIRTFGPAPIVVQGEARYVIDVPLPPHIQTGDWTFQGETTYDCGTFGGPIMRYRTREMPFTVVAKLTSEGGRETQ